MLYWKNRTIEKKDSFAVGGGTSLLCSRNDSGCRPSLRLRFCSRRDGCVLSLGYSLRACPYDMLLLRLAF